jgi:hypothetical protein
MRLWCLKETVAVGARVLFSQQSDPHPRELVHARVDEWLDTVDVAA